MDTRTSFSEVRNDKKLNPLTEKEDEFSKDVTDKQLRVSADDKNKKQIHIIPEVSAKDSNESGESSSRQLEQDPKTQFDLDILAKAVAKHETASCTKGYGAEYNNCFGIKWGRTAPCDNVGRNKMCIYEKPEDSYEAFKIIWARWYGELPTIEAARIYSGNDRAETWRNNVIQFYNEFKNEENK